MKWHVPRQRKCKNMQQADKNNEKQMGPWCARPAYDHFAEEYSNDTQDAKENKIQ